MSQSIHIRRAVSSVGVRTSEIGSRVNTRNSAEAEPATGRRTSLRGRFRLACFGIPRNAITFEARGFRQTSDASRSRLEAIGRAFADGYHSALASDSTASLALCGGDAELEGFIFEGAAMALALRDILTPGRRARLASFLAAHGERHEYMIHVGAGWAFARLRRPLPRHVERFDPILRWLIVDGFGFHEGYFHWPRFIARREPPRLPGYFARAFDQGLGRSLWFVDGADALAVASHIVAFEPHRRPDLWSGVGLAAAYAGGAPPDALERLRELAVGFEAHLAQGAAFAAKARLRAGIPGAHTDLACRILGGASMSDAAGWSDEAIRDLPPETRGPRPGYEVWRERIRERFLAEGGR
jgi:hypothetical protein